MEWEVRQSPEFRAWLTRLKNTLARAVILRRLDRIAMGNFGDAKPVGDGISEFRIDHGPGYRVYFIRRGEALIVLLCGGDKGSQARDIARARALAQEI